MSEEDFDYFDYMPDELLLMIGKEVEFGLLTVLKLCSKRFLRVFSDVTLVPLTTKQRNTVSKMTKHDFYNYKSKKNFDPKCIISCGVGTGKTVIALNAIQTFIKKKQKVLICTPELLFPVWKQAFVKWCSNLPKLYEYHVGIKNVSTISDISDKEIVLTKTGLRCTNSNLQFKDMSSNSKKVSWNLLKTKWDVIICDDVQIVPRMIQVIQDSLREQNHPYKMFCLNASNTRKGNLVNYMVDEELPDRPKLEVNIYSFQSYDFESIKPILDSDRTSFGVCQNQHALRNPRKLFSNYKHLDEYKTTQAKIEFMQKFGKKYSALYGGKNTNNLIKGHNLYPQEVNYVYKGTFYYASLSFSNIYQLLGRCHRTFSPHKKVYMNIILISPSRNDFLKVQYFFAEYLTNTTKNFSSFSKYLKGGHLSNVMKPKNEIVKPLRGKHNILPLSERLKCSDYRDNLNWAEENDYYYKCVTISEK